MKARTTIAIYGKKQDTGGGIVVQQGPDIEGVNHGTGSLLKEKVLGKRNVGEYRAFLGDESRGFWKPGLEHSGPGGKRDKLRPGG